MQFLPALLALFTILPAIDAAMNRGAQRRQPGNSQPFAQTDLQLNPFAQKLASIPLQRSAACEIVFRGQYLCYAADNQHMTIGELRLLLPSLENLLPDFAIASFFDNGNQASDMATASVWYLKFGRNCFPRLGPCWNVPVWNSNVVPLAAERTRGRALARFRDLAKPRNISKFAIQLWKLRNWLSRRAWLNRNRADKAQRIFGWPLQDHYLTYGHAMFPDLCFWAVERRGLNVEGIYRVPGSVARVNQLRAEADKRKLKFRFGPQEPIFNVADTCKAYFRELPEKLISQPVMARLMTIYERIGADAAQSPLTLEAAIAAVGQVLSNMPRINLIVLQVVVKHLNKISKNNERNLMDSRNLSRMWAPNVMDSGFGQGGAVLEFIMNHASTIFGLTASPVAAA